MDNNKAVNMLTINAGSSSIKLGLYKVNGTLERAFETVIESIGEPTANLVVSGVAAADSLSKQVEAPDHMAAAEILVTWLKHQIASDTIAAVGHRIVHGGPYYYDPQQIDSKLLDDLRNLTLFDPEHLPVEIQLIKLFQKIFPNAKQVACFDTAFYHDLPSVARLLPIPRSFEAKGIRRYGFHGLSYSFVLQELMRKEGADAANGRLILAHLGNGVSLTAVYQGKSIDTTMSLTPAAGVPMSTRSGDIDPGLPLYLARSQNLDAEQFNEMVNFKSGLLGISETTSDMKELLERQDTDSRAKDAIDLFCYQVKKSIGSLAAALGGLDTLIFTGGMGEQAPKVRAQICTNLEFLGISIEEIRNDVNSEIISSDDASVIVRVIHTDESATIAQNVWQLMTKESI